MQCLPLVHMFSIFAEPFQASFMFDDQQYCFEIIRYCFRFNLLYDEITWYSKFHECMRIIQCFQILMMISQMVYYHMCFPMDTYPILHLYGMRVSDVVKEGSHSQLLVGIYTMHHFLPLLVQLRILCLYMRGFYVGCKYWILTSLNCQDERTLSHYLNGKRGEINS